MLLAAAALLAAACGGGGIGPADPSGPVGQAGHSPRGDADPGAVEPRRPTPIESALDVTGRAVLDPAVVVVELDRVMTFGQRGTTLVVDAPVAANLGVGTLFVVPGVASGRVTAVGRADGGGVQIEFEQPPVTELFAELAVSFSGRPDPARVMWQTDPATASGQGGVIEILEPVSLDDLPDPSSEPQAWGRAPAASEGATVRVALAAAAGGDPDRDDGRDGGADRDAAADETDGGARGCGPARGDEAGPDQALESPGTQEYSAELDDYTISVRHRLDGDCGTHYFKIDTSRDDALSIATSTFGWVTSDYVNGELIITGDSLRQTVDLEVSGELWFSMSGRLLEADDPSGVKISMDAVKKDIPVVIAGVPFLVRLGVPFSFEVRFPSVGDTLTATLLHLSCEGRFSTTGEGTPDSTCTAAPVIPHIAESFGPMSFIIAAGFKAGFGPGISIPMVGADANVLFAGATATLSGSTGLTRSGTAGAPLIDCTRVDRSVQFNIAAEAQVFGLTMTAPTNIWSKSATDNLGRQCPTSGM